MITTVCYGMHSLSLHTEFICEQCFALNGVSALSDLSAAVAQVKTDFPLDAMVRIPNLQQCTVPYGSLLLRK